MPVIALTTLTALVLGYIFYGRFVARRFGLDDARITPAVTREDGEDFVPTKRFYLLSQHFSAIAAAGPIAGPIMACLTFGWLPCLLWIVFGSIFIGAVHDFSSLVASVRHGATSIAEVLREYVGRRAWMAMLIFIWLALIYVLVAFADITANTFFGKTEDLPGDVTFNPGGAVAAASLMYLGLAIVMGLLQRFTKLPLWLLTVVFVPATFGAVWLGTKLSTVLVFSAQTWGISIMAYCCVAALSPLWVLLQPRGYLGGFVLYAALLAGVLGLLFGGLPIEQPMFRQWTGPRMTDDLFPFLFVTIACGACSGFHSLVCSGTTSKQIAKESHTHAVGYGAMLLEGLVALIALATVMFVADGDLGGRSPGRIYGDGLGRFLAVLLGDEHQLFLATFGAMAFSTFVFDTLDVATRLGRYILQEFFSLKGRWGGVLATVGTVLVPMLLLAAPKAAGAGGPPTYMLFWTLFGTANQLLAALTLLTLTVWLWRSGKSTTITFVPMVFVMGVSGWSLVRQVANAFSEPLGFTARTMNGVVSLALLVLAIYLSVEAYVATTREGMKKVAAT